VRASSACASLVSQRRHSPAARPRPCRSSRVLPSTAAGQAQLPGVERDHPCTARVPRPPPEPAARFRFPGGRRARRPCLHGQRPQDGPRLNRPGVQPRRARLPVRTEEPDARRGALTEGRAATAGAAPGRRTRVCPAPLPVPSPAPAARPAFGVAKNSGRAPPWASNRVSEQKPGTDVVTCRPGCTRYSLGRIEQPTIVARSSADTRRPRARYPGPPAGSPPPRAWRSSGERTATKAATASPARLHARGQQWSAPGDNARAACRARLHLQAGTRFTPLPSYGDRPRPRVAATRAARVPAVPSRVHGAPTGLARRACSAIALRSPSASSASTVMGPTTQEDSQPADPSSGTKTPSVGPNGRQPEIPRDAGQIRGDLSLSARTIPPRKTTAKVFEQMD